MTSTDLILEPQLQDAISLPFQCSRRDVNRGPFKKFPELYSFQRIDGLDHAEAFAYSAKMLSKAAAKSTYEWWAELLQRPFYGITNDGKKREGLFQIQDESAPTEKVVAAAEAIICSLTEQEKAKAVFGLDDEAHRRWHNPEIIFFEAGIRLEHLSRHKSDLVMDLIRQSVSDTGWRKIEAAIKTNVFLGEICNARPILNDRSYFLMIFGTPSRSQPWGYTFFGHHTCLNFFFLGQQMVLSPFFIGAEPNVIDQGPDEGLTVCTEEESQGLELMQSLPVPLQRKARIFEQMHDPKMPAGRWHPADQHHLGGAFQDNRVIPYEGLLANDMPPAQQEQLLRVIASFLAILPAGPLQARLDQVKEHLHETYFCWIGGFGESDSFYFRIQSPVILFEFDHHSGVFLTNKEPMKYHIHTLCRTPNGNDYGRELIQIYRKQNARNGH